VLAVNTDHRQHAAPAERNRDPILAVLRRYVPADGVGTVLETAAGSGRHSVHFAAAFPHLTWQPSDPSDDAHASIRAWTAHEGLANVREPLALDVTAEAWELDLDGPLVAMLNVNMIHISPWTACEGLMAKAGDLLAPGGILFMYGPYKRNGSHTAPSNEAFDASLQDRNPAWGVRDLEAVIACAEAAGLAHVETVEMPANNLSVIYRRG